EFDVEVFQRVDIEVVEGKVLLTGVVPNPQNRIDAARIAWQADGVAEVINEVELRDSRSLSDAARDSWITTRLRSAILFDGEIQSINYTIDTVNGAVYLMGIAQSQAELDRVVGHARNIDYVRHVVPYVRIASPVEGG
ncbi:MAG: BON domain-containing protein, partial [Rhodospirillales bacterium]